MKKKNFLAWLLTVAVTVGMLQPVSAASQSELFTDGGSQAVTQAEASNKIAGDVTETEEEFSDGICQESFLGGAWDNATVIKPGNDFVEVTGRDGNYAIYCLEISEPGTYKITQKDNISEFSRSEKYNQPGRYTGSIGMEGITSVSLKIEKVQDIVELKTNLPEKINAYVELGGKYLDTAVRNLDCDITVRFSDGTSKTCKYHEFFYVFGTSLVIQRTDDGPVYDISEGEYQFNIAPVYDNSIKSEIHSYSLTTLENAGIDIPVITPADTNESIPKNVGDYYVYKLQADDAINTMFKVDLSGEMGIIRYTSEGLADYWPNTYDSITVSVEAGQWCFIAMCPIDGSGLLPDNININVTADLDASAIQSIRLNPEKLILEPGQTGQIYAVVEPETASEEIEWALSDGAEAAGFTLNTQTNNPRMVEVTAPIEPKEVGDGYSLPLLKATTKENGFWSVCYLEVEKDEIVVEIPEIDSSSGLQEDLQIGISTGEASQKTQENLNRIIETIASNNPLPEKVVLESTTEGEAVTAIKNAADAGKSIVTQVKVEKEISDENDTEEVIESAKELIVDLGAEENLKIEQKLDISINVKEGSGGATLAKITELPEDKAITFTVLLTKEQEGKELYVVYVHDGELKLIPESDIQREGNVLEFKANEFSDYYIISKETYYAVTYKNWTPYGEQKQENILKGTKLTSPTVPSNYSFDGWKIEGTDTILDLESYTVTENITLVGCWTYHEPWSPTYYTISFDSQGGSSVSSQSLTYGSKVSEPAAPIKEGYVFKGWYKDAEGLTPWEFASDTVNGSMILYAKWEEAEPEVTPTPEVTPIPEVTPTPEVPSLDAPVLMGYYSKPGYLKAGVKKAIKGADGYEYAYSKKGGTWTSGKDFTVFGRTKKQTCSTTKIPSGVYTIRVRAFTIVDGERVYGEWSSETWVEIPTGAARVPKILSVKVKGNAVQVVMEKLGTAHGYDCVLGASYNPIKPTNYIYVKKNQKSTTIVFKNVKKGTYYLGGHAYQVRNGKKVFTKWSNLKRVIIK